MTYKEREGHCLVPADHKEGSYSLGKWVVRQRRKKDKLTVGRLKRLDNLAFVWNPRESAWEEGFRYLKGYKEREGHCRVPSAHKENGFRLGQWVSVQRGNKDIMSGLRRQQLDELGFVWKVDRSLDPKTSDPQLLRKNAGRDGSPTTDG